jgi:hypothetical protein
MGLGGGVAHHKRPAATATATKPVWITGVSLYLKLNESQPLRKDINKLISQMKLSACPHTSHTALNCFSFLETDGLLQKFLLEWGQKSRADSFQADSPRKENARIGDDGWQGAVSSVISDCPSIHHLFTLHHGSTSNEWMSANGASVTT